MNAAPRAFLSTFGATGHVYPMLSLGRSLKSRGYEIWVETTSNWEELVTSLGFSFVAAPDYVAFPTPHSGKGERPTLPEVVAALAERLREVKPGVVVNDFFTLPPILAAELLGISRATVIPHPYPEAEPGVPKFMVGLLPPRTPVGSLGWRLSEPWFGRRARQQRNELNGARLELGLEPLDRVYGGISPELTLVATFPQLEYPRNWPAHVHVTGPMFFEAETEEIEIPEGDEPLVLVSASTGQDEQVEILKTAVEGLAGEPLRVVATLNRRVEHWTGGIPANTSVVDWVSYSQILPQTSVMVCNGGHGTVARSLAAGVPLVIRPAGGDMGENGARVAWSGTGVSIPRPLFSPGATRLAVRRVLAEPSYRENAGRLAGWAAANDGAAAGAELIDSLV